MIGVAWSHQPSPYRRAGSFIATLAGFTLIGLAAAAPAQAEEVPSLPDGSDVSSGGTMGTEEMGFSWGSGRPGMGFAVWNGDRRMESIGWPAHYTVSTDSDSLRRTFTDYSYEGGYEHGVYYETNMVTVNRWNEYTPLEGFSREAEIRVGSLQYVCDNTGCEMVQ